MREIDLQRSQVGGMGLELLYGRRFFGAAEQLAAGRLRHKRRGDEQCKYGEDNFFHSKIN